MKTPVLEIVDRGRGPQLSGSRITVQDLLSFFQEGASNDEIRRWIPSLTDDGINLLMAYIRDHLEEVLQAEKEINEFHERLKAAQPAWTRANDHLSPEERIALTRERVAKRRAEHNGANYSAG